MENFAFTLTQEQADFLEPRIVGALDPFIQQRMDEITRQNIEVAMRSVFNQAIYCGVFPDAPRVVAVADKENCSVGFRFFKPGAKMIEIYRSMRIGNEEEAQELMRAYPEYADWLRECWANYSATGHIAEADEQIEQRYQAWKALGA